jgi:hypothetical protein
MCCKERNPPGAPGRGKKLNVMERNPLEKPKQGDVFRLPGEHRDFEVAKIGPANVYIYVVGSRGNRRLAFCTRASWPRIVKGSTVLCRAK